MRLKEQYPVPVRPSESGNWPQTWRESYHFDRLEVWRDSTRIDRSTVGYAWGYAGRRLATIESVLAACPPPARVLDLAAAQGNFTIALAALGYRVTWNDLRPELIDYLRLKLPQGVNVEFLAGNIFELGNIHLGSYDVVLALEVIEHVAHPDEFVAKIAGLLKPGGVLVLSTPNGGYFLNDLPRFSDSPDPSIFESVQFKPDSDGHIFLLYEDELRRFAEKAGLEVRHLELITNPLTAGHIKLRYVLAVLPDWIVLTLEGLTRRLPHAIRRRLSFHTLAVLAKPGGSDQL